MPYPTFDQKQTLHQMRDSFETVAWAARIVPGDFTHAPMPWAPDDWSVAMNLAHLVIYDESIASPILESMAAGEDGTTLVRSTVESWFHDEVVALSREPVETLLSRLETSRSRQAEYIAGFSEVDFNRRWTPAFATGRHGNPPHSPAFVATKTFQHTWEHGNAVLRAALFSPRDDA